jgi:hypothetical protein
MDGGAYGRSFLSLPMEGLSRLSAVDTFTDFFSDAEPLFLQGTSFEDEGRTNYWLLNTPLTSLKPQVNEEASFNARCGHHAHPSYPLTWIFSHIQLDFIR